MDLIPYYLLIDDGEGSRMAGESKITVSTQSLLEAAEEVDRQVERLQKAFDSIGQHVEKTAYYWEGSGRESFYFSYRNKTDKIRQSLLRFREQTHDLRVMAGVYEEAENLLKEENGKLACDVIL